jgi:hypothetical protein
MGGQPPVWFVTGTDAAGVAAAVSAFNAGTLDQHFALAVVDGAERSRSPDRGAVSYLRRASPLHAARAGVGAAYCAAIVLAALVVADPLMLGVLAARCCSPAIGAGVGRRVLPARCTSRSRWRADRARQRLVSRGGLTVIARLR